MLDKRFLALGAPDAAMADMGGEFEREVKEELEAMGSNIISSAPYSPTQNATCERHVHTWKAHARAPVSEFFISFGKKEQLQRLTAAINYAVNAAVGPSGDSPSQRALGRGIKQPCQLIGQHGNLRLHQRMLYDREPAFRDRVNLLNAPQRSAAGTD